MGGSSNRFNVISASREDESGASLVEYALLVALIAVVCIVGLALLGAPLNEKYSLVASAIATAVGG